MNRKYPPPSLIFLLVGFYADNKSFKTCLCIVHFKLKPSLSDVCLDYEIYSIEWDFIIFSNKEGLVLIRIKESKVMWKNVASQIWMLLKWIFMRAKLPCMTLFETSTLTNNFRFLFGMSFCVFKRIICYLLKIPRLCGSLKQCGE